VHRTGAVGQATGAATSAEAMNERKP
jgi:hypothetical protein